MKWIVITITALAVSADSFVAGFSLADKNRKLPFCVMIITLILCVATYVAAGALSGLLAGYADLFGAAILASVGIANLFKKPEKGQIKYGDFAECVAIGFAVGLDAAMANLSLTLQYHDFCIPLIFAALHYVTVALGQMLGKLTAFDGAEKLSAALLIVLAIVKTV